MTVTEIQDALGQVQDLAECLLVDVRWTQFGFGVDLVFNYVWESDGALRPEVETDPHLVTISTVGVARLCLDGHINPAMFETPGEVGWGLSEVAGVRVEPHDVFGGAGVLVGVFWESGRSLSVEALEASISLPWQFTLP